MEGDLSKHAGMLMKRYSLSCTHVHVCVCVCVCVCMCVCVFIYFFFSSKHVHRPIVYANMSTQPITVKRSQSGWFFKSDKTVSVIQYSDITYATSFVSDQNTQLSHL